MLDELYMQDLANAMRMPDEVVPTGKVTVSGPQVETATKQPEMGTITGIPQTAFEKALETSGVKLSELGDMIDQSAPGTLNTLLGREVPIIGNLKLRDFLPFVGSKDEGKLTGTPAALIAAGTGQPLRGQPVVGSSIGPDGQRYYGTSGSPAMLSEDVGTGVVDVATLGLGRPLAAGAKKAVKATKNMPVGMSTKAVGQGVDELGFYSAAKQAVDAIQQPKGTGQQFLKQIEKTPGVKPDEIKWTGLDEFLQSKKSVTKAEVQEYLDKNRVEIKEVTLADGGLKKKFSVDSPEDQDFYDVIDKQGKVIFTGPEDDADYLIDRSLTKFSKYTLPGGENYREILLTLPAKEVPSPTGAIVRDGKDAEYPFAIMVNGVEANRVDSMEFAEAVLRDEIRRAAGKVEKSAQFKSQHFDQPNILAHLRVNDRVIDGKKTLFVEEVQSDWHQAGRKKGYTSPEADKAKQAFADYSNELADKYDVNPAQNIAMYGTMKGIKPEEIAKYEQLQSAYTSIKDAVPDAPFKTTWSDLSMKRVIQMASEGGYDRIAFTTGKTQAERFDLSKQIDEVYYKKNSDGTYKVEAVGKDSRTYLGANYSPEQLEENIGKELTKKIVEDQGKNIERSDLKSLSGVDLQVGGEGMKGFYDDILPKFLNKYAKKWDAKTGVTEMPVGKGKPTQYADFDEYSKAPSQSSVSVNYIDVTPKMRESVVTKGQPMFAIGAGGAGAAATQEENK